MITARTAIIMVFVSMFIVALLGVVVTRRLTPYMNSRSWSVKRWVYVFLALAQAHGIYKTLASDHSFNWQDVAYFAELLIVYIGLNISNYLLLRDWQRFPMFQRRR